MQSPQTLERHSCPFYREDTERLCHAPFAHMREAIGAPRRKRCRPGKSLLATRQDMTACLTTRMMLHIRTRLYGTAD